MFFGLAGGFRAKLAYETVSQVGKPGQGSLGGLLNPFSRLQGPFRPFFSANPLKRNSDPSRRVCDLLWVEKSKISKISSELVSSPILALLSYLDLAERF